MRGFAILLIVASVPAMTPTTASAQAAASNPDITVTGDNRIVCRRITRTATRMGSGRICRTMAQWRRETGGNAAANDPNGTIDGAADTLEMAGQKVSTGCTGGMGGGHDGPHGPR
jgi:hypothetical protein